MQLFFIRQLVDYFDVIELCLQLAADVCQIFLVQLLLLCQLLGVRPEFFFFLANAFMRLIIALISIIFLLLCYNKLIILLYYYERFLATFIDYTSDLCYYEGDIIKLFLSESYIYCQSLGLGQCKLSMRWLTWSWKKLLWSIMCGYAACCRLRRCRTQTGGDKAYLQLTDAAGRQVSLPKSLKEW